MAHGFSGNECSGVLGCRCTLAVSSPFLRVCARLLVGSLPGRCSLIHTAALGCHLLVRCGNCRPCRCPGGVPARCLVVPSPQAACLALVETSAPGS